MLQSLSRNLIHLIYSTKNRERVLTPDLRSRLFAYQAGIFREWNSPALAIGGEWDHVHALFVLSKNYALTKVIEEVKKASSKWINEQEELAGTFRWQNGYGAFSVSQSHVPEVKQYINNQEERHRTMTFQEEVRLFLKRYGVEYDERYVWD